MFNWFSARCPLDPLAKAWIERRLAWLDEQFGADVFTRRAVILPTAEFFPDHYDASDEAVRVMLERVCRYMDVDDAQVHLEVYNDHRPFELVDRRGNLTGWAAGTYSSNEEVFLIRVGESQLNNPVDLVGTLAHELAHVRLMGQGRVDPDEFDNELLTDLTVVFHGLGIFLANNPRAWVCDMTYWPGTRLKKPEYMTLPMFGYALAYAAWLRGESKPDWTKFLRLDARACWRQSLRYLRKSSAPRHLRSPVDD
jgi:hypothetical protein